MSRFAQRKRFVLPHPSVEALPRTGSADCRIFSAVVSGSTKAAWPPDDIYCEGMAALRGEEDDYEMTWTYLDD